MRLFGVVSGEDCLSGEAASSAARHRKAHLFDGGACSRFFLVSSFCPHRKKKIPKCQSNIQLEKAESSISNKNIYGKDGKLQLLIFTMQINKILYVIVIAIIGTIWHGGVTVTQPVYTGGKIATAYRMAQLAVRMSETQETQTRQEVWVEVATAYTGLVRAQEMQKVAQQYNVLLTELLQNVQAAVRHGMKLRNDELKVPRSVAVGLLP